MKSKMEKQVSVSVVIPTHNRVHLLPRAIESVLNQTYTNWELVIVDDRSTDHTKDLIDDYRQKDPRIRYLINQRPQGPAGARNFGVDSAWSDYIAFLDSDDAWKPFHLECIIQEFSENKDIDWIFAGLEKIKSGEVIFQSNLERGFQHFQVSKRKHLSVFRSKDLVTNFLKYGTGILLQCSVLRKSLFDVVKFDDSFRSAEDILFILEVAGRDFKLAYINKPHTEYYVHDDNLSNCNEEKDLSKRFLPSEYQAKVYEKIPEKIKLSREQMKLVNKKLSDMYLWTLGYNYARVGNFSKAQQYFLKSLKLRPTNIGAWKAYIARGILRIRPEEPKA